MARIVKLNDSQIATLQLSDEELKVVVANDNSIALTDTTLRIMDEALAKNGVKMSDSDGLFFQRQLEAIETQTYDVLYPDLEARECFTTNTFGGAGVTTLTFRSYDSVGKAQVINARATDFPKSEITGKEYSMSVKTLGTAYDFDIDEVAAAQVTGMPLEARRAQASKRGYEELINDSVWYGNEDFIGFFGNAAGLHPEIPHTQVPTGAAGSRSWVGANAKVPDEILADLFFGGRAMHTTTKKIFSPSELWLPLDRYHHIMQTPRNDVSDTTIAQFFIKNNPFITSMDQIKSLNAIADEETGFGYELMVFIKHTSPEGRETIRIRETLPLQFLPVQLHGLVYEVPGRGRFGGLEVTYPAAVAVYSEI